MNAEKKFNDLDEAILRTLQGDIPLSARPYSDLAEKYGVEESIVIKRINSLKKRGIIRRVGGILNHRRAGYTVNALTAWSATPMGDETREEALDRVGAVLSSSDAVSHCYARKLVPGWELPVFAMMHADSKESMSSLIEDMKSRLPVETVRILPTVREWKKVSMKYF